MAGLARLVGDVGRRPRTSPRTRCSIALEQWPRDGVPPNPGAWLMATAKHRAIDQLRRRTTYQRKLEEIGRDAGGELRARSRRRARRSHRRRRPAPRLHRVPPGAVHRGQGGADPKVLGGPAHGRDRPGLPGAGVHSGPADRAGEADARRDRVRAAEPAGDGRSAGQRARRSSTSSSTRATPPRPATTGPDPRCARRRCGWAGCWPGWPPRSPRCTACWR